ncbi:protein Ecm25p [Monosporozyma unispora]|nr:hypothetical protein C6P44_000896 [Kazachstania unispora]
MVDINVNNIFFKSYSIDPNSGHSIYVFDSTYLPDPQLIGNDKQVYDLLIDELMDTLIEKLPSAPFSLVVFSSGFSQKKISWVYGVKMFAKIPKELKYYLQKTYIVHESFFIRTVYQVISNAMSIKFLTKMNIYNNEVTTPLEEDTLENSSFSMVHVPDLTSLSRLIDITRLRISLNVYLHDYDLEEYIDVPEDYFTRLSNFGKRKYRQLIFDKIYKKLSTHASQTELIFQKPGTYKRVNIFLDIIERNNYIDLSQWDIYSLASVFLNFIRNKANPLVPIDLITLPILDTVEYTADIFDKIISFNKYYDLYITIFPLFISILDSPDISKHTSKSLSKAIAPTLCKEKISMSNADRMAVGTRFIKNLLENFNAVIKTYEQSHRHGRSHTRLEHPNKTTSQVNNELLMTPQLPRPRKSSPTKYSLDTCSIELNNNQSTSSIDSSTSRSLREESPLKSFSSLKLDESIPTLVSPIKELPRTPSKLTLKKSIPNLQQQQLPPLPQQRISSNDSVTQRVISDVQFTPIKSKYNEIVNPKTFDIKSKPSMSSIRTDTSFKSDDCDTTETSIDTPNRSKETAENNLIRQMVMDDSNYTPHEPSKIEVFDKELKKQKQQKLKEISTKEQFSKESFTNIEKSDNKSKVSKLAALYEERLQGLQVMNEIMKNK